MERERQLHADLTRLSRLQYNQRGEVHNPNPGKPMMELNRIRFNRASSTTGDPIIDRVKAAMAPLEDRIVEWLEAISIESARTAQAIETDDSEIRFQHGHEWYTVHFEHNVDHRRVTPPTDDEPNPFFLYGPPEFAIRMTRVVNFVGGGEWPVTDPEERERLLVATQAVIDSLTALDTPSAYEDTPEAAQEA